MWDMIKGQGNWIPVGPFLSNSDGVTHITSVGLAAADHAIIVKQTGSMQILASNSFVAVESGAGVYRLYLTNSNCDTYGPARISIVDSSFHLPVFADVCLQNSAFWGLKYSSVAPALQANVSSIAAQVNSVYNQNAIQPTSATWYAAHSSLDIRVSSAAVQVGSAYNAVGLRPTSASWYAAHSSLDVMVSSVDARVQTLPNSQTLNAHVLTLPTSSELNDYVVTLPTSASLRAEIVTLPNSQTVNAHILTLPTSATLNARVATLPNSSTVSGLVTIRPTSATWYAAITSLDVRLKGVTSQTMSQTIDGTVTFIQSQRLGLAVLTGITSGGGTNTLTFRDVGDTKDRLVVTVDSNQNRTSITTRDGS